MFKRARRLFAVGGLLGALSLVAAGTATALFLEPDSSLDETSSDFLSTGTFWQLYWITPFSWPQVDTVTEPLDTVTEPVITVTEPVDTVSDHTATAPEPSAALVFGAGLLVVGAALRRRRTP